MPEFTMLALGLQPTRLAPFTVTLADQRTVYALGIVDKVPLQVQDFTFSLDFVVVRLPQCQTVNEEEIFNWQDERNLFQLGWIHTHPKQTCFMSSIDLHTHYSYQVMLPEAIAIVMAPTDTTRTSGIFRLSDPGGIKLIQNCQMRGFHPHEQPADGSSIYEHCGHVLMSSRLAYQVVDLR
ncbi:hypothetical protein L7F22_021561 [Adiantum nelumboides]|nr:hypothetical protein [Adiantum nelumboides]